MVNDLSCFGIDNKEETPGGETFQEKNKAFLEKLARFCLSLLENFQRLIDLYFRLTHFRILTLDLWPESGVNSNFGRKLTCNFIVLHVYSAESFKTLLKTPQKTFQI